MKVDKSNSIGVNKSLRLRVLIDVRKPLKEEVDLKLRGGVTEKVEVQYEKRPVFCYFCGKLGHGEKDCDDNPCPNPRDYKFSEKLRASPWIVNKGIGGMDRKEGSTCARKLFVVKKKQAPDEDFTKDEERVHVVVEKLGRVSLSMETPVNEGSIVSTEKERESTTRLAGIEDTTQVANTLEQPFLALSFFVGSDSKNGRKFRRIKRPIACE